MAGKFAGESPDLKVLAAEADVDRVVMGTLMRAGEQMRAAVQLVETPGAPCSRHTPSSRRSATCSRSRTTSPVASSRRWRCRSRRPHSLERRRTANPRAYEFYLRANELARSYSGLTKARELYLRALELDPHSPWPGRILAAAIG